MGVGPESAVERKRDRDEGDAPMSGRCRGRARNIWAGRGRVALAVLLTGSTVLSAIGTVALPFSAHAQSEGDWIDPLADSQMTDISANVDQTIADVWNGESGDEWVEPAPVDAAPVEAAPTYDANGNIIDPVSGAPVTGSMMLPLASYIGAASTGAASTQLSPESPFQTSAIA